MNGPKLLFPKIYSDHRGYFFETWKSSDLENTQFVQDNHSCSHKNVIRGLHYQIGNHGQGKLIWVSEGQIWDVFVDLRKTSATLGKWGAVTLNAKSPSLLWIPAGFAHGFETLSKKALLHYKCTTPYHPEAERTLLWNDPVLGIPWKTSKPIISEKDRGGRALKFCE